MPFISRNLIFFHNTIAIPRSLSYDWDIVRGWDPEGQERWCVTLIIEGTHVAKGYGKDIAWAKDKACWEYCTAKGLHPPSY
ncbi:hypothetical protein DL93DRAFT_2079384 [Clavulina sp. PMI_390]|nr:hypothetical protein DL93DRAFT_2079384 [Clavulina sp. PMI_390]